MARYFTLIFFLFPALAKAHSTSDSTFMVMFYNVENYFDTINNPQAIDEFTPDDVYGWTHERFAHKRNGIAQVINSISGNTNPPDLIGLCEVENRTVLQQLIDNTTLKQFGYSILHHNSPDTRGIDVALLYKTQQFRLLDSAFFLMGSGEINKDKREILYAKGVVNTCDTLHVLVVHFPSKRDGAKKTAPLRMAAAQALRHIADSVLFLNPKSNILIMGDFNDTYKSATIKDGLYAANDFRGIDNHSLYNLSAQLAKSGKGSIKYNNRWQLVDMFFVSGNLLQASSNIHCSSNDVRIFDADFLMEYTPANNSYRPKPAYRWINYIGGYSDHLPVWLTLHLNCGK